MKEKETFMQKTIVVWLLAMVCCALWGSAFPCIKIGYDMFSIPADAVGTQILFAGYRFTLAGILTILIGSIMSRRILRPGKSAVAKVVKLSLLQTVAQYLLFYIGLAHTSGVKASVIGGVNVFIAILVASLFFRQEKLTGKKLAGCLLGFAGVILVNLSGSGFDLSMTLTGEGFIFFSTAAYAFSSVFMKKYAKTEDPVMLSGYQFFTGGVILCMAGFLMGGHVEGFTLASTAMLLYLACISAVAYSLWGILLKYNPVSKVAVFGFMNPVFGVVLSAVFLKEGAQELGAKSLLALVLVCAGIYITNRPDTVDKELPQKAAMEER